MNHIETDWKETTIAGLVVFFIFSVFLLLVVALSHWIHLVNP